MLRWANDNSAATVTSGKAGGELQRDQRDDPELPRQARHRRDDAARPGQRSCTARSAGRIAVADQDQTAAGNLQFDVALDDGAFATVTVAGADWSGAGGAAALQTALQTAIDAAVGAGNATATVTGGNGSPAHDRYRADRHPPAAGPWRAGANPGFATLLGNTAVGSDGFGGRQFFTGTDAASLAVSAAVAGNPAAIAAGTAGGGPLDGEQRARPRRPRDEPDRRRLGVPPDDRAVGRRHADRDEPRPDPAERRPRASTTPRSQQSGVSIDEEMTNLVEFQHGYDAAARLLTTIDSMLDTLINHTGLV